MPAKPPAPVASPSPPRGPRRPPVETPTPPAAPTGSGSGAAAPSAAASGRTAESPGEAGGRPFARGETRGQSPTPLTVAAADVVSTERWLARIWPAIALGGGVDGTFAGGGVVADLLRPVIVGAVRLLAAVRPALRFERDPAPAGAPPRAAAPDDPELSLFGASIPAAWKEALFLLAVALIVGLLTFSFWKEKGPAPRTRLR